MRWMSEKGQEEWSLRKHNFYKVFEPTLFIFILITIMTLSMAVAIAIA